MPLDADRLDLLRAGAGYLDDLGPGSFAYGRAWDALVEELDEDLDVDRLGVEYVRLFASGVDGALSPPTESFYRAKARGGAMAEIVANLHHEYRELGLTATGSESADHITSELEVMSALCGREADAWDAGAESDALVQMGLEEAFLRRHLAQWVPEFARRAGRGARHPFYEAVAGAVHAFVVHDVDFMAAVRKEQT